MLGFLARRRATEAGGRSIELSKSVQMDEFECLSHHGEVGLIARS